MPAERFSPEVFAIFAAFDKRDIASAQHAVPLKSASLPRHLPPAFSRQRYGQPFFQRQPAAMMLFSGAQ